MQFYLVVGNNERIYIDPPMELRVVGKFHPKAGEQIVHLEKRVPGGTQWISLTGKIQSVSDRMEQE